MTAIITAKVFVLFFLNALPQIHNGKSGSRGGVSL